MIETALVHIHSLADPKNFIGCGAIVEGGFIATCRHIWQSAGGENAERYAVRVIFPRSFQNDGERIGCVAPLIDLCADKKHGVIPDLVLLRPETIPRDVMALEIARSEQFEHGPSVIHAVLPKLNFFDEWIEGSIFPIPNAQGLRRFTGGNLNGLWFESGSSGSPVFLAKGQQLVGILNKAFLGGQIREAFVIPASIIRPFVFRAQARQIANRDKIEAEQFEGILAQLGHENVPASEIPAKIEAAIAEMKARAEQAMPLSNEGEDIATTLKAATLKLGQLDVSGARALIDGKLAELKEARQDPILWEDGLLRGRFELEQLILQRSQHENITSKKNVVPPARAGYCASLGKRLGTGQRRRLCRIHD